MDHKNLKFDYLFEKVIYVNKSFHYKNLIKKLKNICYEIHSYNELLDKIKLGICVITNKSLNTIFTFKVLNHTITEISNWIHFCSQNLFFKRTFH